MKRLAEHNLPPSAFPVTVEFLNQAGNVVHTIMIPGPGLIDIPPLRATHGPVSVRITYADGSSETEPAPE